MSLQPGGSIAGMGTGNNAGLGGGASPKPGQGGSKRPSSEMLASFAAGNLNTESESILLGGFALLAMTDILFAILSLPIP